jgi:CDP-glycerol glycerophosphotransferase (TagB/SpsB family)
MAAKKPIDEDKVIFIDYRGTVFPTAFELIREELVENTDFDLRLYQLRPEGNTYLSHIMKCIMMVKDIATCRYIFVEKGDNVLSHVSLREGSTMMQMWHACGAFKKFGYSTSEKIFGGDEKELSTYPNYKNDTYASVSSPEVVWAYEEAFGVGRTSHTKVLDLGVSRTDVFFDTMRLVNARSKLVKTVPQSQGKRVILYAPTFRGRVRKARTPKILDYARLKEDLPDDFILLIKHHQLVSKANFPMVPDEASDFAFDVTNLIGIEELLMVSDILITDYSSVIFEYSLLEKPMIFFAYDLETYISWRGFYYPYKDLVPGEIVMDQEALTQAVLNADNVFDKDRVKNFKKKFMSSCDGGSTQRILDLVFNGNLELHRKKSIS